MPEAPVYEDRDALLRKYDVSSSAQDSDGPNIHPIPESLSVKESSNGQFRRRVTMSVRLHVASSGR